MRRSERGTCYRVPRRVLTDTWRLLLPSGEQGLEGVVVWWGRVGEPDETVVLAAYRPRQIAYRSAYGLSVEVPPDAISEMIMELPPGVIVVARVHTHGQAAYHSAMDNQNMLIAHDGAISIVVPDFAREPIDLARCSVNVLDLEVGWRELTRAEVSSRFVIHD